MEHDARYFSAEIEGAGASGSTRSILRWTHTFSSAFAPRVTLFLSYSFSLSLASYLTLSLSLASSVSVSVSSHQRARTALLDAYQWDRGNNPRVCKGYTIDLIFQDFVNDWSFELAGELFSGNRTFCLLSFLRYLGAYIHELLICFHFFFPGQSRLNFPTRFARKLFFVSSRVAFSFKRFDLLRKYKWRKDLIERVIFAYKFEAIFFS